jgi:hypothetical protein
MKPAHLVTDDHVEWRGRCPFLHESAHVEPLGVSPPMEDLVHRSLIAMETEDDRHHNLGHPQWRIEEDRQHGVDRTARSLPAPIALEWRPWGSRRLTPDLLTLSVESTATDR